MTADRPSPGSRSGAPLHPNVVLIVLDCARAKNFSMSGGGRVAATPVLDALAERGTSFPRAVAPSNWTLPSHISMFTGKYPNEHGIRTYQLGEKLPETTAEFLRAEGFETAMFTENVQLIGKFGLQNGFDFVYYKGRQKGLTNVFGVKRGRFGLAYSPALVHVLGRLPPLIAPLAWTTRRQEVVFKRAMCTPVILDRFETWLAGRTSDRPFYTFFNFLDTHEPYQLDDRPGALGILDRTYLYAPRSHLLLVPGLQSHLRWEALVGGYVRSIEDADRKVGQLLEILKRRGLLESTMVIVTSDHGQAFGEMGNVYHAAGATDSVTRVPLIVAPPPDIPVPRRVNRWVSLCEIDSWIRSAAAGQAPFDSDGRALPPFSGIAPDTGVVYCEGPPVSDANRSMRNLGADQFWGHRLLAAYRGDEKYVLDTNTGEVLTWEQARDPDVTPPNRLTGEGAGLVRRDVFETYEAKDASRLARLSPQTSGVDLEIDSRLRSWGYD